MYTKCFSTLIDESTPTLLGLCNRWGVCNPPGTIEGRRRDARSIGRGMGILGWQVYLALSQEEAADGKGDGSVVIVAIFLVIVGQFSTAGSAKLPAFAM